MCGEDDVTPLTDSSTTVEGRSTEPTYCFLDANVVIHCQTFDEVDWPSIVGVGDVCLVLAPAVLKELDKHKNENRNDWIQERARTLIAKLRPYIRDARVEAGEPVSVRPKVSLLVLAREPVIAWSELGLEPGWSDDRLLASIRQFREERPTADVRFAARDTTFLAKAMSHGIRLVDEERIPEIPRISPSSAEVERLQRELHELKQRTPKLEVAFWEAGQRAPFVERPRVAPVGGGLSDEEIAMRIASDKDRIREALAVGNGRVSDSALEEYRLRGEAYLRHIGVALELQRSREHGPRCLLQFMLANTGAAPATDVELELAFPPGTFLVRATDVNDSYLGVVEVPDLPVADWMQPPRDFSPLLSFLPEYSGYGKLGFLGPTIFPPSPPAGPRGPLFDRDGDRSFVWYENPKLSQDSVWRMAPTIAYLPPSPKGGFAIKWTLRADELPKVVTGTLHVKWTRPAEATEA